MSGMKNDSGKPDLTLVSMELLVLLARVREFGNKKYEKNNWKRGFKVTRSLAAALRHIFQFLSGETLDRESGLSHLGHAVASLEHAIYDMDHRPENDDRTTETKQREQIPAKILFTKLPDGSSIDKEIEKLNRIVDKHVRQIP